VSRNAIGVRWIRGARTMMIRMNNDRRPSPRA
jgi:hypothetical protein